MNILEIIGLASLILVVAIALLWTTGILSFGSDINGPKR